MQATPPYRPTYQVRLDESVLRAIVDFVFPHRQFASATQLASGRSFNNRIYFIHLLPDPNETEDQYVLKVSGYFFDARKVQNEVGALTLLKRYCPGVPAPELVAWSETGHSILTADGRSCSSLTSAASDHSWIMMTRRPGRVLELADLDYPTGIHILQDLAKHMANWRLAMPSPRHIGYLRFRGPSDTNDVEQFDAPSKASSRLTLGGLILTHQYNATPLKDFLAYLTYQLEDKYQHLISAPELSLLATKTSEPILNLLKSLPQLLSVIESSEEGNYTPKQELKSTAGSSITFSHMDFSPRNILVSLSPDKSKLEVTGILDFEFAAFLPETEEFLNSIIHQPDDWPLQQYAVFLSYLKQFGVPTPDTDVSDSGQSPQQPVVLRYANFRRLGLLEKIIGNVAPWWITPQWYKEHLDEVPSELDAAAHSTLQMIEELLHTGL